MFIRTPFNQDISNWYVNNVTGFGWLFVNSSFNNSIFHVDTSKVSNAYMNRMFIGSPFNQDINSWNVENVTDFSAMFMDSSFNRDISGFINTMDPSAIITRMFTNSDLSNNLKLVFGKTIFNNEFTYEQIIDASLLFSYLYTREDLDNIIYHYNDDFDTSADISMNNRNISISDLSFLYAIPNDWILDASITDLEKLLSLIHI